MAEQLGFTELEKKWKTPQERASQLFNRLSGKRILIVLDDVWTTLNLGEVGISCEGSSGNCSILLTSRDVEVLNQMDAQPFPMNILDEREAWSLFKDTAGSCVDDSNLDFVAKAVAKECKGLPVAIITVGSALKDKKKPTWKSTLRQLKSSNPKNVPRVLDKVYTPLSLSYNFLQDDAKSLFLLCSIFPDDFEISLNNLALYSMGLKMFGEDHSMEEVRDAVFTQVEQLKSRFLLLDCDDENKVKMHDVIRDVAIFIAKEEGLLGAKHGSEGQSDRNCKWISVFSSSKNESFDHLGEFSFPSLLLLAIHQISILPWEDRELKIGDISLLEGMQGLNVLSLRKSSFKSQGKSVALPKNLRTLCLESCHLKTLSFAGALSNLEILSCYGCHEIKELPAEIGNLRHLKLLDLSGCLGIQRIAAGVIAKLVELEELKMLHSFRGWESSKVKEGDRWNVGLKELQSLHKLRCLQIEIEDTELAKEEIRLTPNIVKYAIFIGPRGRDFEYLEPESEKVLSLPGFARNTSNFASWIHEFASSAEEIYLDGDASINLDLSQVYNTITTLAIENCEMLEEVAKTATNSNQEGSTSLFKKLTRLLLHGMPSLIHLVRPNQDASFSSLRHIQIVRCHKLRNLFSLQRTNDGILLFAQQLERLIIRDCEMMEEVVLVNEENEGNNGSASGIGTIIFSKLVELSLDTMPMLTALVRGADMIKFPLLENLRIENCPNLKSIECGKGSDGRHNNNNDDESLHLFCTKKVHFSGLKHLTLTGYNEVVKNIWCLKIYPCFFQTLENLCIMDCHKLKSLFTPSIAKNLVNLNRLDISWCKDMEQVVGVDEERNEICGERDKDCGEMDGNGITIIFPNLKELILVRLESLTTIGKGVEGMEFPMLRDLLLSNCPKLRNSISISRGGILDNHNHDDDEALHLFCHQKVKFDASKIQVEISGKDNMINSLWCQQIPQHFFRALGVLRIKEYKNIKNLFSSSIVENFVNLHKLWILRCEKIEQVIMADDKVRGEIPKEKCGGIQEEEQNDNNDDGGNKQDVTLSLPKLRYLILEDLPNLTCFGKGMESIEFPMLEVLRIELCPKLIGMVVSNGKSKNSDNEEMEEGQKLKHDDKSSHLLCNHKVKISALERISLWDCNNLRTLFSCTMVEKLVNFKHLSVIRCNHLEKVITSEKNILESSTLFPSLESIRFEDLDSLRMFCEWKGPLEWPCLEKISIEGCPKMEFLTSGSLSTPKLCKISLHKQLFEEEEWNETKDLNRFVHQHMLSKREESIALVVEHGETSKKNMDEIDKEEQT